MNNDGYQDLVLQYCVQDTTLTACILDLADI